LFIFVLISSTKSETYEGNFALVFDGIDDFVQMPHMYSDAELENDRWTLEAWIKSTESEGFQPNIVGFPFRGPNLEICGNGAQCNTSSSILTQLRERNGAYFTIYSNGRHSTVNNWMHVAGVWDNETLSLYVNGELDKRMEPYKEGYKDPYKCQKSGCLSECDEGIQIGGYRTALVGSRTQFFKGTIDEVRIWSVGRTQLEIQNSMKTNLEGHEQGLLYYWNFDEGIDDFVMSSARDGFGVLGGGDMNAVPKWVKSDCPISRRYDSKKKWHLKSCVHILCWCCSDWWCNIYCKLMYWIFFW